MKIAIEARAITGAGGGVKRYVNELIQGVSMVEESIDLSVIVDKDKEFKFTGVEKIVVKRYGQIGLKYWLNTQIPTELEKKGIDLVHYTKADVPGNKSLPTVVTIYDVIPLLYPKSQKLFNKFYWSSALPRAAEKSDKIITISENSKKDIVRELGVSEDKVVVTRLGVDTEKFKFTDEKDDMSPYILYVGTIEPRKNVASLIKSFSMIKDDFSHKLIIVGREYKGVAELKELAEAEGVQNRVEWKDRVEDDELVKLYGGASLFVWPSIYEGWGFPPQEAMACGAPVIVSNGGALPEVVGEAGFVIEFSSNDAKERDADSDFVRKLADEMGEVLGSEELQKEMRAKGRLQAQKYTWENVVEMTIEAYKEVI